MSQAVSDLLKAIGLYSEHSDPELHPCQGSKFHSPRPLRVARFRLINGASVYLCGTCKGNVDLYLRLHDHFKGNMEWNVQRSFGNELRRVSNFILKNRFAEVE